MKRALLAGLVVSCAVSAAWSWTTALAIGPVPWPCLTRNPLADYAQLASAPAGSGLGLFTVTAAVYAACFAVAGWRRARRP